MEKSTKIGLAIAAVGALIGGGIALASKFMNSATGEDQGCDDSIDYGSYSEVETTEDDE